MPCFQPELQLGVIPGMGGAQRLTRLVGRAVANDMILAGRKISASEAHQWGLVSRVVPLENLMPEAERVAQQIAALSSPVVAKAKAAVLAVDETNMKEGIRQERREFWSCFALQDQKEGMRAFIEKRAPHFTHN